MADPADIIEQNLSDPKKASTDAGSVEQHSLKEQMDAADWLQKKKADNSGQSRILISRGNPGSSF